MINMSSTSKGDMGTADLAKLYNATQFRDNLSKNNTLIF